MGNWTDIRGGYTIRQSRWPYPRVWVLPREPDQNWDYTLLGGEIRTQAVPDFREMIRAIAEVSVPSYDERLTIEGYVRCDSDQGEREEWECFDGRFTVQKGRSPSGW